MISVDAGKRRHNGSGTHSNDQRISLLLFCIFRRHFRIQPDLHALLSGKFFKCKSKLIHLMLEINCLLALQDSAQPIALFAQHHLMSPARRCPGRFQTCHSAACHEHFLLLSGLRYLVAFPFPSDQRIDRTSPGLRRSPFRHTDKTSQAPDDLIIPVFRHFRRQERIRQQRSSHHDHIHFAGADQFVHHSRIIQTAYRRHRLGHVLFDLFRQVYVASVLPEHRGMSNGETEFIGSCRYMDQIHQVLHCPGNLYSLIQSVSAFKKFRSAHSKFNRETRPHRFADRGQDLAGKPYPVFETSSILIRAMIKVWRQKLVDQPSMSAVNHNHFITAEFRQLRRVIVCFNNISNLRFCQWSHRKSVRSCPPRVS